MITKTLRRRWLYPVLSIVMVAGIAFGQPLVAQAISWGDLIRGGIQIVQGIQLSRLNDAQETDLGRQINTQLTSREVRIVRDPALTAYVNEIGQRLAANSTRSNIQYTFQVVDQNSINAFATMGGFVYVHRGLLTAADNEAQVASVIGHEIGHIAGKHALKQMRQTAIQQGLLAAGGLDRSTAVNLGVQVALRLPNSRRDEYEADELGVRMLGRTGYAQSEAVAFMRKLLNSSSPPTFLANHPATSDRITRLNQLISQNPASGRAGTDSASYRARLR
ncbi:M48 family metallopeptidase [Leptolyngbya sp. NIES-2104]|uniref:M48 family metallopeptidase n=1 Tax=Leptolyngbya sp. NIES-2104 TaxID=1552121 RepID=UPI0006EC738F|nr:M48 family metallopeptidase [Leptolyngbya sp. NIES-2104]GAP96078.1 putative predicted metal-dependent hydrolase [Leptolyngbya sp. NIES-2104]